MLGSHQAVRRTSFLGRPGTRTATARRRRTWQPRWHQTGVRPPSRPAFWFPLLTRPWTGAVHGVRISSTASLMASEDNEASMGYRDSRRRWRVQVWCDVEQLGLALSFAARRAAALGSPSDSAGASGPQTIALPRRLPSLSVRSPGCAMSQSVCDNFVAPGHVPASWAVETTIFWFAQVSEDPCACPDGPKRW
ncbi:hypothetical protein C8T65DRAFT_834057 [Cerioporus squamosus]|nr:hypothetical protein C8T65DRAFT_834057 [Cerioporus squamosus]